jgi:transcriptional regulator GlxA family with amidase domain
METILSIRWSRVAAVVALGLFACKSPPSAAVPTENPPTKDAVGEPRTAASLKVGFLILDGVYNTELTAPYDMFDHVRYHANPERYPGLFHNSGSMDCFTVAPRREPVKTFEGLILTPHHDFSNCPPMDVLVIPSAEGNMDRDLRNQELLDWVAERAEQARYVISLCDGAFILAAAGCLDGIAATTFPGDQDRFAAMFPQVDLRRGVSFVDAGKAITSVGGRPSFDVALYLIEQLYGERVAQGVAKGLVIDWQMDDIPHSIAR